MYSRIPELKDQYSKGKISRREFLRRATLLGLSLTAAQSLVAACVPVPATEPAPVIEVEPTATSTVAPTPTPTPSKYGGVLRWAFQGDPPTLDIQWTTTTVTVWTGLHIYEALFTYDESLTPIPDLAESYEMSDDGLTHTIKLQQGVLFHNGKEMTVEDVEASLQRYAKLSGAGQALFERVDSLTFPDKYTLEFKLTEVYPLFANALAINAQGPLIYPKEVVEAAGDGEVQEYIGTGPYQFEEWQRDRFIRMVRFDDYVPHGDEPNGYGGKKMAYLDEIVFNIVPDPSTRLAGLLAGDYDRADGVPKEEYVQLKDDPSVKIVYGEFKGVAVNVLNLKSAITSDLKLRQAMQAATIPEPILLARLGHEDFIQVSPSLADGRWYTEACSELFAQNDPEKARQLLAESNYNGETLRWLTTKEFPGFYELSVVHSQQLEDAGIDVELLVSDWATVVERRSDPEKWEVLSTGWGLYTDPMLSPQFLGTFVGWWQTERAEALRKEILGTPTFEERFRLWEDLQCLWYEEVPALNYGKLRDWTCMSPKVMCDFWLEDLARGMWNAWLAA